MTLKRRALPVLALAALAGGCMARTSPIRQGSGRFLGEGSLQDRAAQIKAAAARRGWVTVDRQPGWITATLNLRTHQAVVDIRYDTTRFTIDYASSVALNYDGQSIHSNYNSWIVYLQDDIVREPVPARG